jgi:hypothetical protein
VSHSLKSRFIVALALVAKLIVTLVFFAALPACATKPATFAQKDPHADLYAFKTFAFYAPGMGQRVRTPYTTLVGEQLKDATRIQMERLGYIYDESNPDLRVNITLAVQQRAEVRTAPGVRPLPYRAWNASNIETVEYRQGTLAIDIVDAQRRSMVWRGVAQERITHKDMQKGDETIRNAVRELFTNYPRKA